ncbi:MAG: cyclic-di-AMP receptor [Syntrophomonadaceae bacterium]|jgi:uncharacterized protein YaaQ
MKMIITVISDQLAPGLSEKLAAKGFRMTWLSSTGGFMRKGSVTLVSCVEDDEVPFITQAIKEYSEKKKLDKLEHHLHTQKVINESIATTFVLPVDHMLQF